MLELFSADTINHFAWEKYDFYKSAVSREKCKNEIMAPILSFFTSTKCASSLTISIQIGKIFTKLFICTALQDQ